MTIPAYRHVRALQLPWLYRAGLVALLLIGASTTSSAAGPVSVAVLGLEGKDVAPAAVARLSAALVQSLSQLANYRFVPGRPLEEVKLVFGCMDERPQCMVRVGRSLRVDRLVWGTVEGINGGMSLRLVALDLESQRAERGEVLTLRHDELGGPLPRVFGLMRSLLGGPRGSVRLSGAQAVADVRLDGHLVGRTDGSVFVLHDVAVGPHEISLTRGKRTLWSARLKMRAGVALEFTPSVPADPLAGMEAGPTARADTPRAALGWKVAFWTSLALAVGSAVAIIPNGLIVLSAVDDKEQYFRAHPGDWRLGCQTTGRPEELVAICDRGSRHEMITNILIGSAAGLSIVALVLAYEAFVSPPSVRHRAGGGIRLGQRRLPRLRLMAGPRESIGGLGIFATF